MPCHVPATSVSFRRRLPSLLLSPPSIEAKLDLSKPGEREAQDLVHRFCTGRWPVWQPLGMRRRGRTLYLAVAWTRCHRPAPYSVVAVSLSRPALRWKDVSSVNAARRMLDRVALGGGRRALH